MLPSGLDTHAALSKCPDCGAAVSGGREGCKALFDEIADMALAGIRYVTVRDLAFDIYCMQRVYMYCRSAKSYAAHLTRLCCGIEHHSDLSVYGAIRAWLDGKTSVTKPEPISLFGSLTVAEMTKASLIEEYISLVKSWAADVWEAYASQQDMARNWILDALARRKRMKH
jgi:hypothetical protein